MNPQFLPIFLALATVAQGAASDSTVTQIAPLITRISAPITNDSLPARIELQKLAARAARPGAEPERVLIAKALCEKASDTTLPATTRGYVLVQIAWIGGEESVAPLAGLLNDPNLQIQEYARLALEKNSSPKADAVLLQALASAKDARWQTGFISSLGERRSTTAVDAIAARLKGPPPLPSAALSALGKIASPEAVAILRKSSEPAAVDALLIAARRLPPQTAIPLCSEIFQSKTSAARRSAALALLVELNPAKARDAIAAALASQDPDLQQTAISNAAKVYGPQASTELAAWLPKLDTLGRTMVLRALDATAEKAVIALAKDPSPEIQSAVIETLARIGSAESVPVLFGLANNKPVKELSPLGAALSVINGPGASEAIAKAAASGNDSNTRIIAISALGWRVARDAGPALVTYAAESDPVISRTACAALKSAGSDAEIVPLVRLLLAGKVPNASTAIRGMASRSANRHALATEILALSKSAATPELVRVLDVLSLVGGPDALKTVTDYTRSTIPEVAEGASKALCNWPDFDGIGALAAMASDKSALEPRRVLAMRGMERLILSSDDVLPADRVAAALQLLGCTWRDEERGMALSALASVPYRVAADAMLKLMADPALQLPASQAALNLGRGLLDKRDRGTANRLAVAVINTKPAPDLLKKAEDLRKDASPRR